MTPKEKANELVDNYWLMDKINPFLSKEQAKQCALIAVLSNDVFSYAKEKHSDYNLINAFLITGEAANYKEAVMKSIKIVNDVLILN